MNVPQLRALIEEATAAPKVTGGARRRELPWKWEKNYQLRGETHWALNSPTDPDRVVSLGLVSNDCYRNAPDPEMRLVEAAVNALPTLLDAVDALLWLLEAGRHEGPCDNEGRPGAPCVEHLVSARRREQRAREVLARLVTVPA